MSELWYVMPRPNGMLSLVTPLLHVLVVQSAISKTVEVGSCDPPLGNKGGVAFIMPL